MERDNGLIYWKWADLETAGETGGDHWMGDPARRLVRDMAAGSVTSKGTLTRGPVQRAGLAGAWCKRDGSYLVIDHRREERPKVVGWLQREGGEVMGE